MKDRETSIKRNNHSLTRLSKTKLSKKRPFKTRKVFSTLSCALSVLAANHIAIAHADDLLLTNGLYTDLLFGYGHIATTPTSNGVSGTLGLGYQFAEKWSIESGYVGFSQPNHSYYLYGAIKRRIFLKDDWGFFSELGPAWVEVSRKPTQDDLGRMTLHTGLGITYWCRQNLGFTLKNALTLGRDEVPTTDTLSAGITYFF